MTGFAHLCWGTASQAGLLVRLKQTLFWRELTHVGSVPNMYQLAVGGVVLLGVAMLAHSRERHVLKIAAVMTGVTCLAAAAVMTFLGEPAQHLSVNANRIRIGGACRRSEECVVDSSCVKVNGVARCWPSCSPAGKCFPTYICNHADDGKRVCTW